MAAAIFLLIILYFVNQPIIRYFKNKHRVLSTSLMNWLYLYHMLFWLIYYIVASFSPSDSKKYFGFTSTYNQSWFSLFEAGTSFMYFLAYPFTNVLGFNYAVAMVLFAWFGYIGFLYFYAFFEENLKVPVKIKGYKVVTLLLFLPNMHYWTSSLGKGAVVFVGIAMFAYAMKEPQRRLLTLLAGSFIVYFVRPHVFLFLALGSGVGYFTGRKNVPFYQKAMVCVAFIVGGVALYDQVVAFAGLNEENVLSSFETYTSEQSDRLEEGGSGVDINSYPLPLKLFTFWFRPLFFDVGNPLGYYVSIENVFYLYLTAQLFDKDFIPYLKRSTALVKMSLVTFLSSSVALSFVMGNLGIVIRQKSQVMYFLFFVIVSFMEYKRRKLLYKRKMLKEKKLQEMKLQEQLALNEQQAA